MKELLKGLDAFSVISVAASTKQNPAKGEGRQLISRHFLVSSPRRVHSFILRTQILERKIGTFQQLLLKQGRSGAFVGNYFQVVLKCVFTAQRIDNK